MSQSSSSNNEPTLDVSAVSQQQSLRIKKKTNLTLAQINERGYLESWGDPLDTQPYWPNENPSAHLRLTSFNMNGISSNRNYLEWDNSLQQFHALQSDIICITEPNLDFASPHVRDDFFHVTKLHDQQSSISVSASNEKPATPNSTFKPGGTITNISGAWSGRVKKKGNDKFGRWSFQTLLGKGNRQITIITMYRVCEQKGAAGTNTAYLQQQRELEKWYHKAVNPRDEILKDLEKFINECHNNNHTIILTGDANEDMDNEKSSIVKFLQRVNMKNVHKEAHPGKALPITYDRGSKCIDFIAISNSFPSTAIKQAGFLPFYKPFATDHRGSYVDLDIKSIFGKVKPDITRPVYRRFTTNNAKRCDKYLDYLEKYFDKARLFEQTEKLHEAFKEYLKDNKSHDLQQLIEKCKRLEKTRSEYMIAAEKRCGPSHYESGISHSPKVLEAVESLFEIKKIIRQIRVGLEEALPTSMTLEEAYHLHSEALKDLRAAQKTADADREAHLDELAIKRATQWKIKEADALKIIKNAEASRRSFSKITRLMKGQMKGTLKELLVPNKDDPSKWDTETDPKTMHDLLLQRNADHLLKSKNSINSRGKFDEVVGDKGEKEANVSSILDGTFDCSQLKDAYPEFGDLVPQFVEAMASPKITKEGLSEATAEFSWKFGETEYNKLFTKTRESTACGPSGLHMSHWKAATERPRIANMYAFFMWAAFKFGFIYDRWAVSWHCMIQKKDKPYINKLRIVQLFEGDFNGGLKYLLGRKLMYHILDSKQMDEETYGSIPGKSAQEAMSLLQLLYDVHRLTKLPLAVLFNDADGCYDRIKAIMAEIAARRVGCPKNLVHVHTLAQLVMKHFIRTAAGVSEGYVQWNKQEDKTTTLSEAGLILLILANIGGIGQGGGSGPVLWLVVLFIMIAVYRKYSRGAQMCDPCGIIATIVIYIVSYVDDNTLLRSFNANESMTTIMSTLRQELSIWQQLLQITGGDLSLGKCTVSVMKWKWIGWDGIPTLISKKDHGEPLQVTSVLDETDTPQSIKRMEPWEADRQLGIRLPLTGTFTQELTHRKNQAKQLATSLYAAPLSRIDAYTVYRSYYLPALQYPLPITTFNDEECHAIQKPFVFHLLPKLGLNRHTCRTIIYGPTSHGGSGAISDLRVEQRFLQLQSFQQYLRQQGRVGNSLRIAINTYQIIIGSSTPFFNLDPEKYNYGDPSQRVDYIWKTARSSGITIALPNAWVPRLRIANDQAIMDIAANSHFQQDVLSMKAINACRLYLQVLTVQDISNYDGRSIQHHMFHGPRYRAHPTITFPYQPMPTKKQWGRWKSFLSCYVLLPGSNNHLLLHPLQILHPLPPPTTSGDIIESLQNLPPQPTMTLYLQSLPPECKAFLGQVTLPEDDGLSLIYRMKNGFKLQGASDGSHIPSTMTGAHAYVLCMKSPQSSITEIISGVGRTPPITGMSSQQPEHCGLIGLLLIIYGLCHVHGMHNEEAIAELWIDNKEVLRRGRMKRPPRKFSNYSKIDYDLWALTRRLLSLIPIQVSLQKVKAHQDDQGDDSLDLAAEMNIYVDALASQLTTTQPYNQPPSPPLLPEGGVYYLDNKNGTQIGELKEHIIKHMHVPALLGYYQQRRGWTDQTLSMIQWKAMEGMLNPLPPQQRLKAMQFVHNWQNVGAQKKKFAEAAKDETTMEELNNIAQCPMQCGQDETHLHYLHCSGERASTVRQEAAKELLATMTRHRTYKGIITILGHILHGGTQQEWTADYLMQEATSPEETVLMSAIREQQQIGWDSMFQGFISTKWELCQITYGGIDRTHGPYGWGSKLTRALFKYAQDMWQVRNLSIHGADDELTRIERRKKAQQRIKELYEDKRRKFIPREERDIFKRPIEQRVRGGIYVLTAWILLAEDRLERHEKRVKSQPLMQWLEEPPD